MITFSFMDGELCTVSVIQAMTIDPNDVESVSIFEPNTEPVTNADRYIASIYQELLEVWSSHHIRITCRGY